MHDRPPGTQRARLPDPADYVLPSWPVAGLRIGLRLGTIIAIALAAQWAVMQAVALTETLPEAMRGPARNSILFVALLVYAGLIALPFVPGVEIGVSLMVLQGAAMAPFVYAATCLGLLVAFAAGRALPYRWLHALFLDLRMRRACALLDQIEPLSPERRLALLRGRLPRWLGDRAVRYRHLAFALALNLPGNAVMGGGGGLSLLAGMSGLFTPRAMVLTVILAVAPVPALVWIWGPGIVG